MIEKTFQERHVLCFCPDLVLRGLQWSIDKHPALLSKYKLLKGDLSSADKEKASLLLVFVDMGQPTPVENLKKYKETPALFIFLQPTPQQLLSVSHSPYWKSISWDGSHYEGLLSRIIDFEEEFKDYFKTQSFVEICKAWFKLNQALPGLIEWINPPPQKRVNKMLLLDRSKGVLTIGAEDSACDFLLPISGKAERAHVVYNGEDWLMKLISLEGASRAIVLNPGQRFQIDGFEFVVRMNTKVEEFIQLAQKTGIVEHKTELPDKIESVTELCMNFLLSSRSGELQVVQKLKHGYIYFQDGFIKQAYVGSVTGVKALQRMLAWNDFQYKFNHEVPPPDELNEKQMSAAEFDEMAKVWAQEWEVWKKMSPPSNLKLSCDSAKAFQKKDWKRLEYLVYLSVCEFKNSKDVMNYTSLSDLEIIKGLVGLRKNGLIRVQ